jgi:hypothetical protein
MDGTLTLPSTEPKARENRGQEWRAEFQLEIQRAAYEKCPSVVFKAPLPENVFEYVESLAKDIRNGIRGARDLVIEWLTDRSMEGLNNPNVVWNMMAAEMNGMAADRREDHRRDLEHQARKAAQVGASSPQPTLAQIAEEELLKEQA